MFRLAEKVTHVGIDQVRDRVSVELESGKKVQGDALIYAVGRQANADPASFGSSWFGRGFARSIESESVFQTEVPHIYAAGDVTSDPALANTSMEQGRLAACHMFGIPFEHMPDLAPYKVTPFPKSQWLDRLRKHSRQTKFPTRWESRSTRTGKEHDAWRRGRDIQAAF